MSNIQTSLCLMAPLRQHSPCVLGWPPVYLSGNVDSIQLNMFPLVALSSRSPSCFSDFGLEVLTCFEYFDCGIKSLMSKFNYWLCLFLVDGGWGPWSPWATCSATCGGGVKNRMRECNSPQPQYGGRKCIGKINDSDSCNKEVCPIGEHKLLYITF